MLKILRRLPSINVRKEAFIAQELPQRKHLQRWYDAICQVDVVTATACRGDPLAVGADAGRVGGESGSCITGKVSL